MTSPLRPVSAGAAKFSKSKPERRIFVLDTNVLMHDPTSIFRFEEHDVYIPMTVLEELDAGKKGVSESARNVRQVSRFLDELMRDATKKEIDRGLALPAGVQVNHGKRPPAGRLFFQTQLLDSSLPDGLPGHGADNAILADTLALQRKFPEARVTLVSKDINLRIKAAIVGVQAEDYSSDKTIEDADLLESGVQKLPANFWEKHGKGMESWQQQSRTFYRVRGPLVREWQANQFVYDPGENGVEAIVRKLEGDSAILELTVDYRTERNNVWGVSSRNREQNFALNLLMDPEIDFVTVLGPAGTGKTLLTLAAGLAQTLDHNRYSEIIMTRVTIPLGEDIGFLPGTEEEKMEPWMGALMDNLEVLTQSQAGRNVGTRRHHRSAAASDQNQILELHAGPYLPQPIHHHRRGAELDAQTDEGPGDPRRSGDQDGVPRQHCPDRHPLSHRNDHRVDICRQPLPRLDVFGAYHPGARRTLAAGRLCIRNALTGLRRAPVPRL